MAVPYSFIVYTGDGVTTQFAVPFGYIRREHLEVFLDGTETTAFTWLNDSTVELDAAPANGVEVKLARVTPVAASLVQFTDGSIPVARDFDTLSTQNLYNNQELRDISDATDALSTEALSTANAALSASATAVSTADGAVVTADQAALDAAAAVTTADTAAGDAAAAVATATAADSKADQAIAAVSAVVQYELAENVAAIPAAPEDGDGVEVVNATGIESFTPLSGLPSGFVGDAGLSVRLIYVGAESTWKWVQYFPNDPDNRYGEPIAELAADVATAQGDITTLQGDVAGLDASKLDASTAASTYAPLASPAFTGSVVIEDLTVSGAASFTSSGALKLPVGETSERPTPLTGHLRFNSSLGKPEIYNGTVWGSVGGGATGGGADEVFVENDQVVTQNYTLTSGKNAMSAGPVTVAAGITVTIPSGSVWVVV